MNQQAVLFFESAVILILLSVIAFLIKRVKEKKRKIVCYAILKYRAESVMSFFSPAEIEKLKLNIEAHYLLTSKIDNYWKKEKKIFPRSLRIEKVARKESDPKTIADKAAPIILSYDIS